MAGIEVNLRRLHDKKPVEGNNLVGNARKMAAMPFPPLPISSDYGTDLSYFPHRRAGEGVFSFLSSS